MIKAYEQVRIGSPFDPETLCGPVHNKQSIQLYQKTLQTVRDQGGKILFGGEVVEMNANLGNFVVPTICEFESVSEVTKSEAFVPILYTMKFKVKLSRDSEFSLLILLFLVT